jgi:hypothetical protein
MDPFYHPESSENKFKKYIFFLFKKMCSTCNFNTQILLQPLSCEALFIFTPDLYAVPNNGPSGPNTAICSMEVSILTNCKGDYKLYLLDDNGCTLDTLVLKCGQFDILDISEAIPVDCSGIVPLYEVNPNYTQLITINANNLYQFGQYVAFEESAYFYRRVTQTYLNLWCGAERNGIICEMLGNVKGVVQTLSAMAPTANSIGAIQAQQIYSLGNNLVKARIVALKQLCDCGKICNDQFFAPPTNPCVALKGCCR